MSSVRGDIQSQGKQIIFNVYSYFKKLSKDSSHSEVANFFLQAQQKTPEACGVSISTIKRITSEGSKAVSNADAELSFSSPRKTYKRLKYATDIHDFDEDVVRRTVHEFYDQGQFPTISNILSKYQEKTGYSGSLTSMGRILRSLKFRFEKFIGGQKFLMERSDIVVPRVRFLRQMVNLRQNNDVRPVVYLDNIKVPTGKDGRIIIFHAGSSSFGFVKGSKLVFRCNSGSSEDYRTQINYDVFKSWFIMMLQNLENPSVIVMDSASYRSGLSEDYPKSNERKIKIQRWLKKKGVECSPFETIPELRERVKQLVVQEKKYELEEIALSMGHEVVRLPPHRCTYNPISSIWAQVKEKVAEENRTLKMADVEKRVHDTLDSVTIDNWIICTRQCHKLQDDDYVKEGKRENILEPIISTINPDDTSDCDSEVNEDY